MAWYPVPGARQSIRLRGGYLELAPEPRQVELKRRGKLLVAVPKEDDASLSIDQVKDTLDKISREEI